MGQRTLIACLLAALLARGVLAQEQPAETAPEMDLVENEDLADLLKDPVPSPSSEAPASETVGVPSDPMPTDVELPQPLSTDSGATEPLEEASAVTSPSTESSPPMAVEPTAPAATTESLPQPLPSDSDAAMSEAVKEADAPPEPLPMAGGDDLDELKIDLRDGGLEDTVAIPGEEFTPAANNLPTAAGKQVEAPPVATPAPVNDSANPVVNSGVFDVGKEERELLGLAASIQGQISDGEWNELATQAKVSTYTVVKDDWLFKISKRLFGSGFYYPKIWALNPFITNPHLIEPGMVLHFSTGTADSAPEVRLGSFSEGELKATPGASNEQLAAAASADDFSVWGDEAKPDWLTERKNLIAQGVYVQYATADTLDDLQEGSRTALIKEYEGYEPPLDETAMAVPADQYDKSGLDKNSRIQFKFKEGFHLNTFVTNNPVQDFGAIDAGPDENTYFTQGDHLYVRFDDGLNPLAGDRYSIYVAQGKVSHPNSDRSGYKYSITGQIRLLGKVKDKWEAEVESVVGLLQRGSRVTAYTPRIERLIQTFNNRLVEAAIVGTYATGQESISFGDVAYIDRGRADGLEVGNVFEVYGFKDRANGRVIAEQPTYKTGELTIITLTDNFATVLVTNSTRDFYRGDIAVTKSKDAALRGRKGRAHAKRPSDGVDEKALDELDVELKVEDLNDSLLDQADKIQLSEDELAELERQEREKSVIKDSERDLKALERLEKEIESAEKLLSEAKLDEDKLLEGQNLEDVERKNAMGQQDSLDEIEENLGKRYLDEDLNKKDNPYGLTEFDVEEVDDLLNVDRQGSDSKSP